MWKINKKGFSSSIFALLIVMLLITANLYGCKKSNNKPEKGNSDTTSDTKPEEVNNERIFDTVENIYPENDYSSVIIDDGENVELLVFDKAGNEKYILIGASEEGVSYDVITHAGDFSSGKFVTRKIVETYYAQLEAFLLYMAYDSTSITSETEVYNFIKYHYNSFTDISDAVMWEDYIVFAKKKTGKHIYGIDSEIYKYDIANQSLEQLNTVGSSGDISALSANEEYYQIKYLYDNTQIDFIYKNGYQPDKEDEDDSPVSNETVFENKIISAWFDEDGSQGYADDFCYKIIKKFVIQVATDKQLLISIHSKTHSYSGERRTYQKVRCGLYDSENQSIDEFSSFGFIPSNVDIDLLQIKSRILYEEYLDIYFTEKDANYHLQIGR